MAAVFPLLRDLPDSTVIHGTGFFISGDGHFLTCAHTFEEHGQGDDWRIAAFPDDLQRLVTFRLLKMSLPQDVALCQADIRSAEFFRIAVDLPDPPAAVRVIGYAGRSNSGARIEEREGLYLGHNVGHTIPPFGKCSAKRYPAIYTQPSPQAGFSGGPVLHGDVVIGLHTAIEDDMNLARALHVSGEVAVSVRFDLLRAALAAGNVQP